jgi:subtilisin family serine protease
VNSISTLQFMYQGYFDINSTFNTSFQYIPANIPFPANISGYPLYALDFNTSNPADACNELPPDTPTLSGKIVLIRRGTCTLVTKIVNVQKFGAQYVIIYTNNNPVINPQSPAGVIAAMVSAELGIEWVTNLQEGDSVNFYFPTDPIPSINNFPNNLTGGTMSTFSSWSPTYELSIKPEVSAPGGNILSTYPIDLGAYAVLSGTSMATPYIAGVLALYMSAKGSQTKFDYQILRQILATTATPLFFNDGTHTYPYLAPAIQQGGGLVNAFAAVHYTTIISPSTLSLNDSMYFNKTVEFTISNTDSVAVSYTLTHVSLYIIRFLVLLTCLSFVARSSYCIHFGRKH